MLSTTTTAATAALVGAPRRRARRPDGQRTSRFFHPTPSASGVFASWLGVYLDTDGDDRVDWDEIAGIVEDAFRPVAPKTLIHELDDR